MMDVHDHTPNRVSRFLSRSPITPHNLLQLIAESASVARCEIGGHCETCSPGHANGLV